MTCQPPAVVAPAISTLLPLVNLEMSAAATVTTAGLALLIDTIATAGPSCTEPPSHDQTPSTPLHMTVNLYEPRLAKEVHDQSSPEKPVLRLAPVSALKILWLVDAAIFGVLPYHGIITQTGWPSACVQASV